MSEVTQILKALEQGEKQAASDLLPLVYNELRRLAAQKLAKENAGQTIQPTALVHEAYIRLVQPNSRGGWENRRHFFLAAAEAMRRILIDRARLKRRDKRGGAMVRCDLTEDLLAVCHTDQSLLVCHDALDRLEQIDSGAAAVAKLHVFLGLTFDEVAATLDLSPRTVYRDWNYARSWLFREFQDNVSSQH